MGKPNKQKKKTSDTYWMKRESEIFSRSNISQYDKVIRADHVLKCLFKVK